MTGNQTPDELCRAARGSTDFFPGCDPWDDFGSVGDSDLPRAHSWLADLQVIEIIGVGAGLAALVSSLLPLFFG